MGNRSDFFTRFSSEIKTPSCWKSSKRIFRPFPDLRVTRRKKKEETLELPRGNINHCCATGRTCERGELSVTRDVISANEIANRVNWRRDPRDGH